MSVKPLSGIKVLDLTWVYAGPFATQILGDLGAEIIKIEAAPVGDKTRIMPPFKNGYSGYFATLNRGKKSLALNLKSAKGRELFLELARKVDVLTENFAPRALEQLGELGFWRIALASDGEAALQDAAGTGDVALVLGSEGSGIRRLVRERCDAAASVPIDNAMESLNVSNAAAIALYELRRQS